jgi:hypothetical protein
MNPSTNRISGLLRGGVVALTALTAAIHLWLSLGFLDSGGLIFVLNGLGYLALLFLFSAPLASLTPYRAAVRWALIAYTAVTVIAWLLIGTRSPLAYVDKVAEGVLIVLLWLDAQQQ